MAVAGDFQSFLFAAAVAGIALGGTLLMTWINNDKLTERRLTAVEIQLADDRKKLEILIDRAEIVLTLDLKVRSIEVHIDKQAKALEDLRQYRVPRDSREAR